MHTSTKQKYSPLKASKLPELKIPTGIHEFLEELLEDGGFEESASEIKVMMLNDLFLDLQNKIFLSLSEAFSEDQLETYIKMSAIDQDQAVKFAQETLPNYEAVINGSLAEFKKAFLNAGK